MEILTHDELKFPNNMQIQFKENFCLKLFFKNESEIYLSYVDDEIVVSKKAPIENIVMNISVGKTWEELIFIYQNTKEGELVTFNLEESIIFQKKRRDFDIYKAIILLGLFLQGSVRF